MSKLMGDMKLGDIVAACPKTAGVFIRHQIDFCCGGYRTLRTALHDLGRDVNTILDELNDACNSAVRDAEMIDFMKAPLPELLDHIIDRHHSYLRNELPQLAELTEKIMRVHGANHDELRKVQSLFRMLKQDLEKHLDTEEQKLFPLIKEYAKQPSPDKLGAIIFIIEGLEAEHDVAGGVLKELRSVTNHYKLPADACTSYRTTYKKLIELEADLFQHIHLENNILHNRLKASVVG